MSIGCMRTHWDPSRLSAQHTCMKWHRSLLASLHTQNPYTALMVSLLAVTTVKPQPIVATSLMSLSPDFQTQLRGKWVCVYTLGGKGSIISFSPSRFRVAPQSLVVKFVEVFLGKVRFLLALLTAHITSRHVCGDIFYSSITTSPSGGLTVQKFDISDISSFFTVVPTWYSVSGSFFLWSSLNAYASLNFLPLTPTSYFTHPLITTPDLFGSESPKNVFAFPRRKGKIKKITKTRMIYYTR
ncbi:hypothetical protein K435DRAFT_97052 [Dendrothele bispora CBS 962.96]|uniref:Uncharacterized protein n=1 Tax=Dendrothele bispora (strain CBS 962.96) TaxID=1314807 RepID=A0A4S8M2X3_DENBC|nr:hypothetical protein K435DRAFT_97052 [Dendrothele bispora CBS 962.96]